jgi:two-component system alkaline phosphatase synthesis response regulator PhoP
MEGDFSKYRILLVDDEKDVLEFMSYNLKKEHFQVFTCDNGEQAIDLARQVRPHLILLDIMMPGMDGVETCEVFKTIPELKNTIIAFLSALGEDFSVIAGFEAGADDYITKPIKPKVLIKKIIALLKRSRDFDAAGDTGIKEPVSWDLIIDRERFVVIYKGKDLLLPKKEFELLSLLISKPQRVFSREEIYQAVWGDKIIVGDRTIDVHIRKLREKIGENFIFTVKGVGYKFIYPEEEKD